MSDDRSFEIFKKSFVPKAPPREDGAQGSVQPKTAPETGQAAPSPAPPSDDK